MFPMRRRPKPASQVIRVRHEPIVIDWERQRAATIARRRSTSWGV